MSYEYSPLSPVYKADHAIELEEVAAPSPASVEAAQPAKTEDKCNVETKCKRRRCTGPNGEPLSKGRICCRCIGVTIGVMFMLWVVTGTVALTTSELRLTSARIRAT